MTFANYILEAILPSCIGGEHSANAVRLIAAAVIRKLAFFYISITLICLIYRANYLGNSFWA